VFSILVVREFHDIVLHLSGTLDTAERGTLGDCIEHSLAERPRRLVLELSGIEHLDTDGAEAVRDAVTQCSGEDVELVLQGPAPAIRDALEGCAARIR
jgi:anti-anti-sigma factor